MTKVTELPEIFSEIQANLLEASQELTAKIDQLEATQNLTPEGDQLLTDIRSISSALAAKVPNPPAPEHAPEPAPEPAIDPETGLPIEPANPDQAA